MHEIIIKVLEEIKDDQINMSSEYAREILADKLVEKLDPYLVNVIESVLIGE
mgnify:CR=1 FL=1|tara:strand:+ start:64 stop:219 length:156 start_codon:yes stop_codon:yes gene_type:complete